MLCFSEVREGELGFWIFSSVSLTEGGIFVSGRSSAESGNAYRYLGLDLTAGTGKRAWLLVSGVEILGRKAGVVNSNHPLSPVFSPMGVLRYDL